MKKAAIYAPVFLLLAGLFAGCGAVTPTPDIEVITALAKPAGSLSSLVWRGSVEALQTVEVSPNSPGKVQSIQVQEGQQVKAGELLFSLDDSDLRLQVNQGTAALHSAEAAFSAAAASQAADSLVRPAQIARDDAKASYERLKVLYEAQAIPENDLNTAKSRWETAEAQLRAAEINQKSAYDSAKAQVDNAGAALAIMEKKLADCAVFSPIDGLVTQIHTEVGAYATAQAPAVTVIDGSGLEVVVQVPEGDIGQLAPGLALQVQIQAVGETYTGAVKKIGPVSDRKTGMFEVKVALPQEVDWSRLGFTTDVRIAEGGAAGSVYVPAKSVTMEGNESWVYLVKDGSVSRRQVTLGEKRNAYLQITAGLSYGDEVVVQSSGGLQDGDKVRVIKAD